MLSLTEFRSSLQTQTPPSNLSLSQTALWWIGKKNWAEAHRLVQSAEGTRECDRIHALLHRQEGDLANACYWYARADARMPDQTIIQEWEDLVLRAFPQTGTQPS
ncbi:hypothetical protein GLF_1557 [Gluconobacter frateurii NBRC 101659]|uniref:hypothetical protein n=1 Tax=Gluconobacter japonicus TaxID=376620 RepID=UPI00029B3F28|nr:hypothetical protein GLF_1557 [Gluconobacter frateurii NBRC 101659]